MRTSTLIDMLARGAGPAPRTAAARRVALATAAGLLASAVLACVLFGPMPAAMVATPAPWIKLLYLAAWVSAAGWLTLRLARPVPRVAGPRRALGLVMLTMALLAVLALAASAPQDRLATLLGQSWRTCPWNVLALSLPALGAVLLALRGLAPTRLRAAGLAAGLLAGAVGALGYSLACPEPSLAFVAAWYSLGIVLTGAVGLALGPRVLRW